MKPASRPHRPGPRLRRAAVAVCLLALCSASRAELSAQLDRNEAQLGEIVTLNIESDDARSGGQPDLGPLHKDFVVLGTSRSSQTSFINGRRSDRRQWLVRLRARHTGTLDIPPIKLGNEQTQALALQVDEVSAQAAAAIAQHVFLQVEATAPARIYVQQQLVYTVRLFYDSSIQTGELSAPASSEAMLQQIGDDRHYTAMRGGHEYKVIERHYALTPEKSGTLHIAGPSFSGTALLRSDAQGPTNPAEDMLQRMLRNTPFANDPAWRMRLPFGVQPQPVAASAAALTLEVRPLPAAAKAPWLPAGQVTLHDSWRDHPPQLKAGEPATRVITIETKGLTARQIPALTPPAPANARVYPETADNQSRIDGMTIHGTSEQRLTYIPNAQGRLELAPIALAWWNTDSDTPEVATLPAQQFDVAPGVAGAVQQAAPAQHAAPSTDVVAPPAPTTPPRSARWLALLRSHWVWQAVAAALIAVLAVLGVALWRRRRSTVPAAARAATPTRRENLQALQRACAANDARSAATALLVLARSEWPDAPPAGLSALAARLDAGAEQVRELERSLYAAGAAAWDGTALWAALRKGLRVRHGRSAAIGDGEDLRPLYR